MKLNVLFGGKQGKGVDGVATLAAEVITDYGYYTFKYRDYGSLIKGGHAFDVLAISDEPIDSHDKELDYLFALDEETVEKHKHRVKENGEIIKGYEITESKELGKAYNMVLLGAFAKLLSIDPEIIETAIENKFADKGEEIVKKDLEAAEKGYQHLDVKHELNQKDKDIELLSGSHGIADGAIGSGLDVYLAYPMTPATPVLHILAQRQEEENIVTFQPENELSVVNAGLGSAHTGAKTMVGSSGGGYDLMQEAMSMQGISEIPLVVYLSQRAGAGSGIPTYTAQGDLEIALKSGHGEFPRVVIAPGDAREAIKAANEAFYFAENYRLLSVLLGDKHLAESDYSVENKPELTEVGRNIEKPEDKEFDNYKITSSGNSPRSVPGEAVVNSTSYEHNEYGITIEDEETINAMTEKRKHKGDMVKLEAEEFERYKVHGSESSDNLVIGWGSTKGAIKDAIEDLDVKFVQIIYLEPFPSEILEHIEDAEQVALIENNSTGGLANVIAENTGYMINDDQKILKYDGRPFNRDKLKEKIKEMMNL